jgi:hypothetical protein
VLGKNVKIDIRPDVQEVVKRTFTCVICLRAPLKPPAAFQRCCQSIVGCMFCLEELYKHNMGSNCPKCRAPRGCSSMCEVRGLDELLGGLSHLGVTDDGADESDDSLPDIL